MSLFAIQIYCDFSGYSDIARGLARWMGYHFPKNFNKPYVSKSMREFWSRWHISLSTWFRDYLYIPLGGSKQSALRNYINLWITMIISGLWHGAAWTFVIWGAYHALLMSVERIFKWQDKCQKYAIKPVMIVCTLMQIWIGWAIFRAKSLSQAWLILQEMFTFSISSNWVQYESVLLFMKACIVGCIFITAEMIVSLNMKEKINSTIYSMLEVIVITVLLIFSIYFRGPDIAFIYFQF